MKIFIQFILICLLFYATSIAQISNCRSIVNSLILNSNSADELQSNVNKSVYIIDSMQNVNEHFIYNTAFDFVDNDKKYSYDNYLEYVEKIILEKPYTQNNYTDSFFSSSMNWNLLNQITSINYINGNSECYRKFLRLHNIFINGLSSKPLKYQSREFTKLCYEEIRTTCILDTSHETQVYRKPSCLEYIKIQAPYFSKLLSNAQSVEDKIEVYYDIADLLYKYEDYESAYFYLKMTFDNVLVVKDYNGKRLYDCMTSCYFLSRKIGITKLNYIAGRILVEQKSDNVKIDLNRSIYNSILTDYSYDYITNGSNKITTREYSTYYTNLTLIQDNIYNMCANNDFGDYIELYSALKTSLNKQFAWEKMKGQIFFEASVLSKCRYGILENENARRSLFDQLLFLHILKGNSIQALNLINNYLERSKELHSLQEFTLLARSYILNDSNYLKNNQNRNCLQKVLFSIEKLIEKDSIFKTNKELLKYNLYELQKEFYSNKLAYSIDYSSVKHDSLLLKHYTYLQTLLPKYLDQMFYTNEKYSSEFNKNIDIQNLAEKKEILETQNSYLTNARNKLLIIIAIIIGVGGIIVLYLINKAKSLYSQIEANKRLNSIQTLMRNTNEHDVENAYEGLENDIHENRITKLDSVYKKLNIVNTYAETFKTYKNQIIKNEIVTHITTVREEIYRIHKYIELYKATYDSEIMNITFQYTDISYTMFDIPIPFKMVHNFVLNAIKHGKKTRTSINITFSITQENQMYILKIHDDGVGFDIFTTKTGGGYSIITDLISFYNSEKTVPYFIEFEPNAKYINSIKNIGTTIIFYLKKK